MTGRTLALLSCTKSKLPAEVRAEELYSASSGFRLALKYARLHADEIVILSAKHGAVRLDQILNPYEETLKRARRTRKREWATQTYSALKAMPEYQSATNVLWLAGKDYYGELLPLVRGDDKICELPLVRLPQGKQRQWLQQRAGA